MNAAALPSVLLLGAGRMGAAMFAGWAAQGLPPSVLVDPARPPGVARAQDTLAADLDGVPPGLQPGAVILAIKPQMAADTLPALGPMLPSGAVVLSILAGLPIARLSALLGAPNAVVRAMPNTPAAIGQGMIVAVAGPGLSPDQHALCTRLLAASGELAWLDDEALIDPVTAVSGCGPAYVFLLAELAGAGGHRAGPAASAGPPAGAQDGVRIAGALLAASQEESAQLRRNVTSPNGVTERALAILMDSAAWPASIRGALSAAKTRSQELAK